MLSSKTSSDDPVPSAESLYSRAFVVALLEILGPRKGRKLIRRVAELLAEDDALSNVHPVRPGEHHSAMVSAGRGALKIFRRHTPTFLAALRKR